MQVPFWIPSYFDEDFDITWTSTTLGARAEYAPTSVGMSAVRFAFTAFRTHSALEVLALALDIRTTRMP